MPRRLRQNLPRHEDRERASSLYGSRDPQLPAVRLEGLMCIPRPESGPGPFRALRALAQDLGGLTGGKLSMGMTADFEDAIREGSTHVRVGTAIFGPRA